VPASINSAIPPLKSHATQIGVTPEHAGALGNSRLLEFVQRSGQPQYDETRYQVGYAVEDIEAAREELIALVGQPVSGLEGSASAGTRWNYFRNAENDVFELNEHRMGDCLIPCCKSSKSHLVLRSGLGLRAPVCRDSVLCDRVATRMRAWL
jgi:hypothetical protein